MDNQPPPFFKRGPAPLVQLTFYTALSLALLFIDSRFQTLAALRQALSLFTQPIQRVVQAPVQMIASGGDYFAGVDTLKSENATLKRDQIESAAQLLRYQQLENENARLRQLLDVKGRKEANGRVAQILYATRDPYSKKIVIDKGQQDKIQAGQPLVDEKGVLGQITRVFPYAAEATLITDKDQSVPVQILRNGLRSVVSGTGGGTLELRFLPNNADVENGDLIVTSGLDGIYLPGLPVAQVVRIERDTSFSFARIICKPLGGVENSGMVLVLDPKERPAIPAELTPPPKRTIAPSARAPGRR